MRYEEYLEKLKNAVEKKLGCPIEIKEIKNRYTVEILSKFQEKEIDEIKDKFGVKPSNIYCMPLGASKEELAANAKSVFEFCAKEGYCYSDRLHIRVFDKKRGV